MPFFRSYKSTFLGSNMNTPLATSENQDFFYLNGLNPPQKEAVLHLEGPILVLAGAGTGKTRVLTTRIGHLLATRKAYPSEILAVTFTNKAAHEMHERVTHLLGRAVEGLWLGTFHALSVRFLRRHAELLGFDPSFTILDEDDQIRLIKELIRVENIDEKKYPPRVYAGHIGRLKDRGILPHTATTGELGFSGLPKLSEIYKTYQNRLKVLNAFDFGDLILQSLHLFRTFPDILDLYQERFRFILVDEYQDTNLAQYLWLRLLGQKATSLCCVGDDDQSIYGWRGAEVGNILRFEREFPGAKIVRLEQNYRSTPHILAAASHLIAHNKGRLGKTLWTDEAQGEKILIRKLWDGQEEALFVGEEIENLHRNRHALSQIAVLVRAGFQTRSFEERFLTLGIPYRVIGGPRFYERQEIRDSLAYFRCVAQPKDSLAFERIINTPRRGIGPSAVKQLHELAREKEISLMEAARLGVQSNLLKGQARIGLLTLIQQIDGWRSLLESEESAELAKKILEESGYTDMWRQEKTPDAPGRLENLKELVQALKEFPSLPSFLEHVSLVLENATQVGQDQVVLMTLHSAKGLEFDTVFLTGWEEGIFPHARALSEVGEKGLEEERRLAYVGLTRAKKRAIITYAANRQVYNQWQTALPSRFLKELPEKHIEQDPTIGLSPSPRDMYLSENMYSRQPLPHKERSSSFKIGQRVFHTKFGYGTVTDKEGDLLEVHFDHTGLKKIMDSFLKKA